MLTPVRKRSDYHHGDLRDAAIRVAWRLVESDGLPALGIRKVATRLGVTPAALYRHFESLEDLQRELSAEIRLQLGLFMTSRRDKLKTSSNRKTRELERFRSLGDSYIEFARLNPKLFELAFFSRQEHLLLSENTEIAWVALQECLNNFVALKMMSRRDALDTSLLSWSAVHGLSMLVAQGAISPREFNTFKNSVLDSVRDSIIKS